MRKVKLFLWLVILILTTMLIFTISSKFGKPIGEEKIETSIPTKNTIDKDTVINKLSENMQIVGLNGDAEKEFEYVDNKWSGNKKYKMKLHASFKFGINIADIKREDITISNGNVIIRMPEIILISFDVPYDKIEIDKTKGWFRADFNEEDRQLLYSTSRDSMLEQILNDESIINNSNMSSQNAIKSILMMIPEVESVSFK